MYNLRNVKPIYNESAELVTALCRRLTGVASHHKLTCDDLHSHLIKALRTHVSFPNYLLLNPYF